MDKEKDNLKATLALGTKPVGKLLLQYAMPAIIAMVASSLYNIIDRAFIGQVVGPLAISGLAITFPFMNLSAAFGAAVGVGSSTAISVKLGQKDYRTAEELLGNTVTLNLIVGFSFAVICLTFLDPILYFFGASEATIPYARSFMHVILCGNMITHMYLGMNAVLRAASKPRQAMNATIFTVVMNILLDVLFILVFGWGIKGAALATVFSQSLALVYQMRLFTNKKEILHLKRGIYGLKGRLVKNIVAIGVSPFLMNVCACFVIIFINNQLVRYGGDLMVGAYGIASAISTVFIMIIIGLNQGMQPIAGYNYGAQKIDRLMSVLRIAMITATIIVATGWTIAMTIPNLLARIFTDDPTLSTLAMTAIRLNMMVFFVVGFQMVVTNFFQCIGKVKISIFLSLSRQLLFLLPLLYVFPLIFGVKGVWYAIPTSDFTAATVAAIIMSVYMRKFKRQINSQKNE
ncbi:MAG TPA: MATE family efflux transporter [Prevotella sp.]|nr:MATE family efflux transporter [Prevotella sp.]